MITFISTDDLSQFVTGVSTEKLEMMVQDAVADATRVAPCLLKLDELVTDPETLSVITSQVRSILRSALTRWVEAGSGAAQSQNAGPFSMTVDTRQQRRGMFWPSEITALQGICRTVSPVKQTRAFNVDQIATMSMANHYPWCSITWGSWCSCGADLTHDEPLYEGESIA